ncbi:MAG: hypothetical protein EOP50_02910 [Sphingobacteriales bacterium]|nr:MAG: hypothetical protein EOP50_02910 [Sphingobacteriales bacterium]
MNGIRFVFPDATNDIILVWYKNSNPAQEVGRSGLFAPSTTGYTYAPPNLEAVPYKFYFWETTDGGTTLQTLRATWSIDGSALLRTPFVLYTYVVDRGASETESITGRTLWQDPVSGETGLLDTRLSGETFVVFTRGIGPLRADEWSVNASGFDLATPGASWSSGDTISVLVSKSSQVTAPPAVSESYNDVTDDETLSSDYFNKHNVAGFDTSTEVNHTTTFPAFAAIPDGTLMEFSTFSCPGLRYWKLQFAGSDTVAFMGQNRDNITLGINERVKLRFKSNGSDIICTVTKYDGPYARVGEVIMADNPDMPGMLLADGVEYDIADYPRLMEEINYGRPERIVASTPTLTKFNESVVVRVGVQCDENGSPVGGTGTAITYYPNRGKFIINAAGGKFRVPDERGQSFRVLGNFTGATDATRLSQGAGGRQAQELIKHGHYIRHGRGGGIDTNPNGGAWIAANSTPINDPYVLATGGTEQRVDNSGKYALIQL